MERDAELASLRTSRSAEESNERMRGGRTGRLSRAAQSEKGFPPWRYLWCRCSGQLLEQSGFVLVKRWRPSEIPLLAEVSDDMERPAVGAHLIAEDMHSLRQIFDLRRPPDGSSHRLRRRQTGDESNRQWCPGFATTEGGEKEKQSQFVAHGVPVSHENSSAPFECRWDRRFRLSFFQSGIGTATVRERIDLLLNRRRVHIIHPIAPVINDALQFNRENGFAVFICLQGPGIGRREIEKTRHGVVPAVF